MLEKLKSLLKTIRSALFYSPYGVRVGRHVRVMRPWNLSGRQYLTIGDRAYIGRGLHIEILRVPEREKLPAVRIGADVYLGRNAFLTCIDEISIGNGSVLSDSVYITDENHGTNPFAGPIMEQPLESKGPVQIGCNCFLGYRVAVLPGVTLGEHCVVGANSTVTKSFPAYSMLAGSPQTHQWVRPNDELHRSRSGSFDDAEAF
jgi:acetyltransferase-like isoleucine patch superfamily enzyme